VARRTREFSIRLVLGADPENLLLFVLRRLGYRERTIKNLVGGTPAWHACRRIKPLIKSDLLGRRLPAQVDFKPARARSHLLEVDHFRNCGV